MNSWALKFQNVGLILVGAGPPCQGVSGLNAGRRGAMKDVRSSVFQEVPRIIGLFKAAFPWAQVRFIGESVASMDSQDRGLMSEAFEEPWRFGPFGLTLCHRPKYFWVDWDILPQDGSLHHHNSLGDLSFDFLIDGSRFLLPGWEAPWEGLPAFTTPGLEHIRRPAGLASCKPHERARWEADEHRYPPYQYRDCKGLTDAQHNWRLPAAEEKEVLMGFPVGYTRACMAKAHHKSIDFVDKRHRLLGTPGKWEVQPFLLASWVCC